MSDHVIGIWILKTLVKYTKTHHFQCKIPKILWRRGTALPQIPLPRGLRPLDTRGLRPLDPHCRSGGFRPFEPTVAVADLVGPSTLQWLISMQFLWRQNSYDCCMSARCQRRLAVWDVYDTWLRQWTSILILIIGCKKIVTMCMDLASRALCRPTSGVLLWWPTRRNLL